MKHFYRDVECRTLSNLLRIFICKVPGKSVEVQCVVQTGSIHEEQYLGCGLSHFLEHMLFNGCRNYPGSQAADTIDKLGGQINAYTSYTHTNYHASIPCNHLDQAIEILGSMVRYPMLPEDSFRKEKEVILREVDLSLDKVDRRLFNTLSGLLFQKNPVRHPVIGYPELIAQVDRERMADYYHRRYTPGRTYWVVVGNVETAAVIDAIAKIHGDWPMGALAEVNVPQDLGVLAGGSAAIEFDDPLSRLMWGVPIPDISGPDLPALELLNGILGGSESSRLTRKFELERHLALDIRSFSYLLDGIGIFGVSAKTKPDKLNTLKTALAKELDDIAQNGLKADELRREKNQQIALYLRQLRDFGTIASNIVGGVNCANRADLNDVYINRLENVTLDELNLAAQKYLNVDTWSKAGQIPKGQGVKLAKAASNLSLAVERETLPGGQRLLHIPDRRLPLVDFSLILPGGAIFEKSAQAGISRVLTNVFAGGTVKLSEGKVLEKFDDWGAVFNSTAGMNSLSIELSAPRSTFLKAYHLLLDLLHDAVFPEAILEREKHNLIESLKSRKYNPMQSAVDARSLHMYGSHPYSRGTSGNPAAIKSLDRMMLLDFYHSILQSKRAVTGFAGDISMAEAQTRAAELIAALPWGEKSRSLPHPPEFPQENWSTAIKLDKEQTIVAKTVAGVAGDDPQRINFDILYQAENGLSSRLFKEIREHNALAYAVGSDFSGGFHRGLMMLYAATSAENIDRVGALLDHELARLATDGLSEDEFLAARESAAVNAAHRFDSPDLLLEAALLNEYYHLPLSRTLDEESRIRAVTCDQFNQVIRQYFAGVPVCTVVAGKIAKSDV